MGDFVDEEAVETLLARIKAFVSARRLSIRNQFFDFESNF
jgi:hypothetical protein